MKECNKKIMYKNGMCGGTEETTNKIYETVEKIKSLALESEHRFSGDYSVFTYKLKNMTVEYWINDDYGVPYSIEYFYLEAGKQVK